MTILACPVCAKDVADSEDAEEGDIVTCAACGRVFVIKKIGKFKSLQFPSEDNPNRRPVISI